MNINWSMSIGRQEIEKYEKGPKRKMNVFKHGTSEGNQEKFFKDNKWYKVDLFGYEGKAEWAASEILKCSTLDPSEYITYKAVDIEGRAGCVSDNFLKEGEILVSFYRLFRQMDWDFETALNKNLDLTYRWYLVIQKIEEFAGVDVTDYLRKTLTLDAFIFNEDRHLNNLALTYEKEKGFKPAPIFDNGLSLLADTQSYMIGTPVISSLRRVWAKPFNEDFEDQIDTLGIGFKINKAELEDFLENNIEELGRIYDVVKYSMNKYDYLLI